LRLVVQELVSSEVRAQIARKPEDTQASDDHRETIVATSPIAAMPDRAEHSVPWTSLRVISVVLAAQIDDIYYTESAGVTSHANRQVPAVFEVHRRETRRSSHRPWD
jgi:hypothetical protein